MPRFWHEVRYGWRVLLKSPVFTFLALLTLALGTGATVAIYSVVHNTLLRPLPYPDPDRLIVVDWASQEKEGIPVSPGDYFDWRAQSTSFTGLAAWHPWPFTLTGEEGAERITGAVATANLFELMGVEPMLGRGFDADGPGAAPTVVLGHGLWQRSFGSDPSVLGQKVLLDDEPYEVVGVMPSGFDFAYPGQAQLWQVSTYGADEFPRDMRFFRVLGRLEQGVSLAAAQTEMSGIAAQFRQQYPDDYAGMDTRLAPLHRLVVKDVRQALLFLQLAVVLALAIACFNVANLQLARAATRREEVAARAVLGASRFQIFRQLLSESLLLGLAGGAAGLAVGYWGVRFLVDFGRGRIHRLDESSLDGSVLAFALGLALLAGLLSGLAPALASSRFDFAQILKAAGRSSVGASRTRNVFVFLQVAITLVLLVGAGLLIQSLIRLQAVSPGFQPENLLTMQVSLPAGKAATTDQTSAFYRELKARVEGLPGVESLAVSFSLPLAGGMSFDNDFAIEGRPVDPLGPPRNAQMRPVSPGYFRTLGIPLIAGRTFSEHDDAASPGVVVVNQEFIRMFLNGSDALGERMKIEVDLGDLGSFAHDSWEIVGIVGDVKHRTLESAALPEVYFSTLQGPWRLMNLSVRTALAAADLAKPIVSEIHAIDPSLPVVKVRAMEEIISDSMSQPRFNTWLLSLFAGLALTLTLVGIYGVVSYSVYQRRREIGLRMALGARRKDVLWQVVGHGMALAAAGVAAGLVGSFFVVRLLSGLLFGVSSTDPATYLTVSAALALVALLACYLPARRASGLDPITALRYE